MIEAFSPVVPSEPRAAIRALAELAQEFVGDLPGDTWGDDPKIEPVEWESRDGFISWNLGGYSVNQSYSCGWGSGYYRTDNEREFVERVAGNALADFLQDKNLPELPKDCEEFYNYEQDYMADLYTIAEVELMIPHDTPEQVQVSFLMHYADSPYHRSKRAEVIFCKHYLLDTLAPAEVMQDIITAYGGAK